MLIFFFFVSAGVQILKGRSENLSGQASNGEAALAAVSVGIELCCFCLDDGDHLWGVRQGLSSGTVHNSGSGGWKRERGHGEF